MTTPSPLDPSSLSDEELNRAIAEAMGWRLLAGQWREPLYEHEPNADGVGVEHLPPFATSIDALSEPEQRLRDAGWFLTAGSPDGSPRWWAEWRGWPLTGLLVERVKVVAVASTEARARAEACLSALLVIKDTTAEGE